MSVPPRPDDGGAAATAAAPVLRTEHLRFHIGGVMIVDGVSLDVRAGELVSVIGPNGAGKTSFFNLLSGLYRPTGGRIELAGRDVTGAPPPDRARAGLGRSFQTASVFPGLSAFENVRLAVQLRSGGGPPFRRRRADREEAAQAHDALGQVGLAGRGGDRVGTLSHADRRKVELAMLVAARFDVLLLDEPTAGLSVEEIPMVLAVIRAVHRDRGTTVLMVEHRMDVVGELSDRIAVMHHGRLLSYGPPAEVMADPAVREAYLGAAP
ncbi:MAG TPA: ABC transporter ATP-binding protein [bacterium]|nr:ABC transporter ATP-binding protein [bacterium]